MTAPILGVVDVSDYVDPVTGFTYWWQEVEEVDDVQPPAPLGAAWQDVGYVHDDVPAAFRKPQPEETP